MSVDPSAGPVRVLVGFARALRAAGVPAAPERVHRTVAALAVLDPGDAQQLYWAARLTLCSDPGDIERFDLVFRAYFADPADPPITVQSQVRPRLRLVEPDGSAEDAEPADADPGRASASTVELLRHRDIAGLGPSEREDVRRLIALMRIPPMQRRTRRLAPSPTGDVDPRRTVRALLRQGGEVAPPARRRPGRRPRRVVLLVDVSGSMSDYADALLRFAHAARHRSGVPTEVFTIGTRLTRVTRELGSRDPEAAMRAVAGAAPDWGGGTRLGRLTKEFLDRWGQRGMARGAVAVFLSDGWERENPQLLGDQMARLHRLAYRVVWANPRKGRPGYAPLAGGIAAALPHIDEFVEGHSLAALAALARAIAGASAG